MNNGGVTGTYSTLEIDYSKIVIAKSSLSNLSFKLPASYAGDVLEGWVFTGHRGGVKTSPSFHLGEVTIS